MKIQFSTLQSYMFWSERGVAPADLCEQREGTTVRYSSQKYPYRGGEGTTIRYFAVSRQIQRFSWK
ncbi:hypothetical protein GCM10008018_11130 [Paenibacillus marchantiophytorum]|uniref:Uncharacterized protein n=1 Tax=Paenibacillus marchantiophytorum TaxID=1619310 RepID=A0ABQ2BRU4_9BACL|nr:hypothetical protein GCM10008018_11130 [Paenibacillus marchantiophytorum]